MKVSGAGSGFIGNILFPTGGATTGVNALGIVLDGVTSKTTVTIIGDTTLDSWMSMDRQKSFSAKRRDAAAKVDDERGAVFQDYGVGEQRDVWKYFFGKRDNGFGKGIHGRQSHRRDVEHYGKHRGEDEVWEYSGLPDHRFGFACEFFGYGMAEY